MPLALLVDRDTDTRQMYAEFLRQAAYDIDEAEDGREALAKAVAYRPSVIVTETRLPGMSGLELCRVLRRDRLTQSIPTIVVTADGMASNLTLAEAAGADAVLVKPCLPDRLLAEIDRVLSRSRALSGRSAIHERVAAPRAEAGRPAERSTANTGRRTLNRSHQRHETSDPPVPPPAAVCPACDRVLTYAISQIGGVNERFAEQWDYFECARCQLAFEYRQRTRKLRPCAFEIPRVPARRA